MNLFKTFDEFLNSCVDYAGNKIFTGKFILDILSLINIFLYHLVKRWKKLYLALKKSPSFSSIIKALEFFGKLLLKIPLLNVIFICIIEAIKILIISYSELFIAFAITFTTTILLLGWFQTAIITFFIAIIP